MTNSQTNYFLPFTPEGKATELQAIHVKDELGVAPDDPVDPYAVLPAVPARLIDPDELRSESAATADALFEECTGEWSAIGYGTSPVTGESLILVNPSHHLHRQRVSLMEEEVHIVLDHPKTELHLPNGDGWSRPYDHDVEDEAYTVGAACILPYKPLFNAVNYSGETVNAIAARFGVSVDYVRFRIKRAGLSRVYSSRQRRRC
jgi:hypothetical protein